MNQNHTLDSFVHQNISNYEKDKIIYREFYTQTPNDGKLILAELADITVIRDHVVLFYDTQEILLHFPMMDSSNIYTHRPRWCSG